MRIVYITERFPFGSGESFIQAEVDGLLCAGHEVLIYPLVPPYSGIPSGRKHLEANVRVTNGKSLKTPASWLKGPRRIGKLMALIWTVVRGSKSAKQVAFNLMALNKAAAFSDIVLAWRADHLHAHWANRTATLAMAASSVSSIPWSMTAHRYDIVCNNLWTRKVTSSRFVRYIAEKGRRMVASMGMQEAPRSMILHMGVDVPAAVPPLHWDRSQRKFRIVCSANLVPVKGHQYLLEAVSILVSQGVLNFTVTCAGDGERRPALESEVKRLGIGEYVTFEGHWPHGRLLELYSTGGVDAVVLPSVDLGNGLHEGIPVSLMEAMAHGIPVISTDTGGISELISGGAGMLVEPESGAGLAGAIEALFKDESLRLRTGALGRERVIEHFNTRRVVEKLVSAFKDGEPGTTRGETAEITNGA